MSLTSRHGYSPSSLHHCCCPSSLCHGLLPKLQALLPKFNTPVLQCGSSACCNAASFFVSCLAGVAMHRSSTVCRRCDMEIVGCCRLCNTASSLTRCYNACSSVIPCCDTALVGADCRCCEAEHVGVSDAAMQHSRGCAALGCCDQRISSATEAVMQRVLLPAGGGAVMQRGRSCNTRISPAAELQCYSCGATTS